MTQVWDVGLLNPNPNTVVKVQSGSSLAPDLTAKRRRKSYLKGGECVRSNVEGGHLHVVEKIVEMLRMENYLGERLVADALPQHDPTI